ncbi:MAG TPA: hypothetical protein VGE40_11130 [Bacilli bacterium]
MLYNCPVCNGLQDLTVLCPKCQHQAVDHGRIDDYAGPYSPYRPIDDLKLTNGFPDLVNHQCVHVAYCKECNYLFTSVIDERRG